MVEESDIADNWRPPYGLALLASGDREAAMAVLDALDEPPLDYFWLTTVQTVAELAVGLGRTDVAARLFDALVPYRDQLGITASGSLCFGLVATTLGQLALATGDLGPAVELLTEAEGRAEAMGAPFELVKSRRLLASALLGCRGPLERAVRLRAGGRAGSRRRRRRRRRRRGRTPSAVPTTHRHRPLRAGTAGR
jgi:hypothetical protein